MMKQSSKLAVIFFLILMSGCAVAGGILKAGIWAGLLIAFIIVTLLALLIKNISKKI